MYPSMRSKLLQKLLYGFSLKISAIPTTTRKLSAAYKSSPLRGRQDASEAASSAQAPKIISASALKKKPLPVI